MAPRILPHDVTSWMCESYEYNFNLITMLFFLLVKRFCRCNQYLQPVDFQLIKKGDYFRSASSNSVSPSQIRAIQSWPRTKRIAMLWTAYGGSYMARTWEQHAGSESNLRLMAVRKQGPWSCSCKKPNSSNNLNEFGRGSQPPDENSTLADIFISALWNSEQRAQTCCACTWKPQELT